MKKLLLLIIVLTVFVELYAPNIPHKWDKYIRYEYARVDCRVKVLCKSILYAETKGNYTLHGLSGEYGGYQFLPSTWEYYCKKYIGKVLDIRIPENQDLITTIRIRKLVEKGYTNEQIAAIWNCGYSNYTNRVGVNSHGVLYDVPAYVSKVMELTKFYSLCNPVYL